MKFAGVVKLSIA